MYCRCGTNIPRLRLDMGYKTCVSNCSTTQTIWATKLVCLAQQPKRTVMYQLLSIKPVIQYKSSVKPRAQQCTDLGDASKDHDEWLKLTNR